MKLSRAEKTEQERLALRQQLMDQFGMSEKLAQEYFEAMELLCKHCINEVLRKKAITNHEAR